MLDYYTLCKSQFAWKIASFGWIHIISTLHQSSPYHILNHWEMNSLNYIFVELQEIGPLVASTFCFAFMRYAQNGKISKLSTGDAFDYKSYHSLTYTTLGSAAPDHGWPICTKLKGYPYLKNLRGAMVQFQPDLSPIFFCFIKILKYF